MTVKTSDDSALEFIHHRVQALWVGVKCGLAEKVVKIVGFMDWGLG